MAWFVVLAAWVVVSIPVSLLAAHRLHQATIATQSHPAWFVGPTVSDAGSRPHDVAS